MFVWYDYFILVIVLFLSTSIGIYFGYFAKKPVTTKEYLSGGKQMRILPVAISVTVSHFSAIALIGVPADIYKYGAFYMLGLLSFILYMSASIFIYYPVLFKTKTSSIFEYLEQRFDRKTRLLSSFLYILFEILMISAIIYSPSLALSVGFNINLISFLICGVCIFYTAIGGLRTVIWTDIFQYITIMLSCSILIITGLTSLGGISEIWEISVRGGRLDIFDFDFDLIKKDSFWTVVFGEIVHHLYYDCLSQSTIQKYSSLPTQRDIIRSVITFSFCIVIVKIILILMGLILYATYENCDPVLNQQIGKNDQIVPYYVEQVSTIIPGISGLFMTAVVSAGISTLSSSLNALSGVIYNDFISNFIKKDLRELSKVAILKTIVILLGLLCTGLATIVPYLGDIIPMIIGSTGLMDGPSLGLVTLAVLFPSVNSNSAFYATISGVLFVGSIYIPSRFYYFSQNIPYVSKPLSNNGCTILNTTISEQLPKHFNFTNVLNETIEIETSNNAQPFFIFRISYHYFCFSGTIITIILGLIFSYVGKLWNGRCTNQQIALNLRKEEDEMYERETKPFMN